jgi:hypothetical protein
MTILASRQHTCIHPQVSKMAAKDEACKKLNKNKMLDQSTIPDSTKSERESSFGGCTYFNKFKGKPLTYENYGFKQNVINNKNIINININNFKYNNNNNNNFQ